MIVILNPYEYACQFTPDSSFNRTEGNRFHFVCDGEFSFHFNSEFDLTLILILTHVDSEMTQFGFEGTQFDSDLTQIDVELTQIWESARPRDPSSSSGDDKF